jgi:hypothetical protein
MMPGALQTIHERGPDIPSDIAVVGFDDMAWATSPARRLRFTEVRDRPGYRLPVPGASSRLAFFMQSA